MSTSTTAIASLSTTSLSTASLSTASASASYMNDPMNMLKEKEKEKEKEKKKTKSKSKDKEKEKEEKEVCPICADTYTVMLRRKVVCKFCSKDACTKCIEHYLLSRAEDAHCIHCRVNYSDTVLKDICTKTYLQHTYFRHRQAVLVNRERANLPALQNPALEEKRRREIVAMRDALEKEIGEMISQQSEVSVMTYRLEREIGTLRGELAMKRMTEGEEWVKQMTETIKIKADQCFENVAEEGRQKRAIRTKREEMTRLWHQARNVADGGNGGNGDEKGDAVEEEKRKFVRRCMKMNCQGFLSTAWKCGLCEHYSCGKCFTERGPNHDSPHECKKEDIETADMIRKDSKLCPGCGVYTQRTAGCSQMFCVSCHTPWEWDTGKIVTKGVIHNPHYYEWLKRTGGDLPRNPADVPCGGYPNGWELRSIHRNASARQSHYFFEFHRICMEVQDQSERGFRSHIDQNGLSDTHIRFLLNDFEEKEWGRRLAIAEKKRKRDAEVQEVFAAFRMVAVELLNRIQHYRDESVDTFLLLSQERADAYLERWNNEVQALIGMVNEGFKGVSVSHNCTVPYLESYVQNRSRMDLGTQRIHYRLLTRRWQDDRRRGKMSSPSAADVANTLKNKPYTSEEEEEEEEEVDVEEEEEEEEKEEEKEEEDIDLNHAIHESLKMLS